MASTRSSKGQLESVLVTGGCGFLGSHLIEQILRDEPGCKITSICRHKEHPHPTGVIHARCDISSATEVEAIMKNTRPIVVFHVAAPLNVVNGDKKGFRAGHIDGTRNLLESSQSIKTVKAFIFTSSSSVIHDNKSDMLDGDESWPRLKYPQQKKLYSLYKVEAEELVENANRGPSGMLTVNIRPAGIFGERDYGNLAKVLERGQAGKANLQLGDGRNMFTITYVANVVHGHLLAARALLNAYGKPPVQPESERVEGEAFFITNDQPILFWDYVRGVAARAGQPVKKEDIKVIPKWLTLLLAFYYEWSTWVFTFGRGTPKLPVEAAKFSVISRVIICEKAKRVLGYRPLYTVEEGIERGVDWFLEEQKNQKAIGGNSGAT